MKRIAVINPDADPEILRGLKKLDMEPVFVPHSGLVAPHLAGHPDLQIFPFGHRVFCHPDMPSAFLRRIGEFAEVVPCASRLSPAYPGDIAYNVACTGRAAFHRMDRTDPAIREVLEQGCIPLINVPQGYSRCSTLIVSPGHIVTADATIHRAAVEAGIACLPVRPGHVTLPGYPYGFIGGASGHTDGLVLLTGSLESHPDGGAVAEFIEGAGVSLCRLAEGPLTDLGSIFVFAG